MSDKDPWSAYRREEMEDPATACQLLAHTLWKGQLTLLLGAGVSRGVGLPDWTLLVERAKALTSTTVTASAASGTDLLAEMDRIRSACGSDGEFIDVVRRALYGDDLLAAGVYPATSAWLPLLNALGALVMSSARGSAAEVFNLNFDDLLEWYLYIHGFTAQIVHTPPNLLDGHSDVRVYHLHGFIPLARELFPESESIVLTKDQYLERLSEESSAPWSTLFLSRLHTKVFLSIGSSMSDFDIGATLKKARKVVDAIRPMGFVLVGDDEDACANVRRQGLVPVRFPDFGELPQFLLDVCRMAAEYDAQARRATEGATD